MFNYRLIIEYHLRGNNHSQIAIICACSRMTVVKVLRRIEELAIDIPIDSNISDRELAVILFPKSNPKADGYLIPDYSWEQFQMVKHQASIRLCWRRYCKRAAKQNLKAYSWSNYIEQYHEYKNPPKANDKDAIRRKLQDYNFLMKLFHNKEGRGYLSLKAEKEKWLKSLHLEEDKILDDSNRYKE